MPLTHFGRDPLRTALGLLVSLLFCLPASAETVTVEATAKSEHEAIQYALAEAVRRVNGVSVETGGTLRPEVAEAVRRIEIEFDPRREDSFHIRSLSNGYVRGYDLLTRDRSDAGVTITLEAHVLSYDPSNPRPGARTTVVADRFELAPGALQLDQPTTGEKGLLSQLREELTESLVRSCKFTVLTREHLGSVLAEQQFIAGGRVATSEKAKLHNLLGADWIVAGRIERVHVHSSSETVKLTGYTTTSKAADVELSMTVYDVATGEIRWTGTFARGYSWNHEALQRDPEFKDDGLVARTMILEAAAELTRTWITETFPPKVVDVDVGTPGFPVFVLNAGDALISVGDQLELLTLGKALRDPDTGEELGRSERLFGHLRVTAVDERLSRAVLMAATQEQLTRVKAADFDTTALICRPRPRPAAIPAEPGN